MVQQSQQGASEREKDNARIIELTIGHTSWYWCHHPGEPTRAKFSFFKGVLYFGERKIPVGVDLSDRQAQQWLLNAPAEQCRTIRTVKAANELDLELIRKTPGFQVLECDSVSEDKLSEVAHLFAHLRMLYINSSHDLEDLTSFGKTAPLMQLVVSDCENLFSLDGIDNLKNLVSLEIINCDSLWSLDQLASAKNLRRLIVRNCENVHELNAVGVLPRLQIIELSRCRQIRDLSPLEGLAMRKKDKFMGILQQNVDLKMFVNIKKILQDIPLDEEGRIEKGVFEEPAEGKQEKSGVKLLDILRQDVNRGIFNNIREILQESPAQPFSLGESNGDSNGQSTSGTETYEEGLRYAGTGEQTLGQHLVQNGFITEEQLKQALAESGAAGADQRYRLWYLNLSDCPRLVDVSVITKLPSIRELHLFGCRNVKDLRPLYHMRNIRRISMPPNVTNDDLTMFCTTSKNNLIELDLRNCTELTDISPISELAGLRELKLSGCTEIESTEILGRLQELTKLDLTDCIKITDLAPLLDLEKLQDLYIGGCAGLEREHVQWFSSEKPDCRLHYV